MFKRIFAAAFLSIVLTQGAFAEEMSSSSVSSTSGSGAVVPVRTASDILQSIRALASNRNPQKLADILVNAQKQKALDTALTTALQRMDDHRTECRDAIRRANRDEITDRTNQCVRTDLLSDVAILHIQTQQIGLIPMIDAKLKATATSAIAKLSDAEMTIVNAIDTGLFQQTSQLQDAKQKLRATYREPVWLALTHLRADRELTWSIFIAKSIQDHMTSNLTESGSVILDQSTRCLESGSLLLHQATLSTDRVAAAGMISQAQNVLKTCRTSLMTIAADDAKSQQSSSSSK